MWDLLKPMMDRGGHGWMGISRARVTRKEACGTENGDREEEG
jgi:hypothetical protein